MAPKKKNSELATLDSFAIVSRYDGMDPELLEELQDELGDLDSDSSIACRTIKIPAGGGLAYEVQGEDDNDLDYEKEIDGVIVFTHRMNGLWQGSYGSGDDRDKIPICSSMDGKTGIWRDTGEVRTCENCPMNQFGTADDGKGGRTRGKACKNMRRLYMMLDGDPNFYLLSIPPTSIKEVNHQLAKIMGGKRTPYTGLVVSLTLERSVNGAGVPYSKVVLDKKGILPPAAAAAAREMRRQIKEQYQKVTITLDDYVTAPVQDAATASAIPADGVAQFTEVEPTSIDDDELPFR